MRTTTQRTHIRRKRLTSAPAADAGKPEARINFIASSELDERITSAARSARTTKSNLIREAVKEYILKIEKNALDHALEEGYKAYYGSQSRMNAEWEAADAQ
jgi:predicted DNA-binding protein